MWVLAGGTSFPCEKDSDRGSTRVVPLCLFHRSNSKHIMCLRAQGEVGSHDHMLVPAGCFGSRTSSSHPLPGNGSSAVKWGLLYYILGGRGGG